MGFFAEINAWLDSLLATYIGNQLSLVATAIEPAVVTLCTLYVMGWGLLHMTGRIQEPLTDGLSRIARLIVVLGVGLKLWLYHSVIIDGFLSAPQALAAAVFGARDPVTLIDEVLNNGGDVASMLIQKGNTLTTNISFYIAGYLVYATIGATAVYTIFLLLLAKVALSVLLALGPLFIASLLLRRAARVFEGWLAQMTNYALVFILASAVVALLMQLLTVATTQAVAQGDTITIAFAMKVCMAALLVLLVLRQVQPMASGIAGGMALGGEELLRRAGLTLVRAATPTSP